MDNPRPTYTDIVLAYLREGPRAWQAREEASAAVVRDTLGLTVDENMDLRQHLQALELISGPLLHDYPDEFHLLPKGIALMDGSPTLESLLALPGAAIAKAAPTPQVGARATVEWKKVIVETVIRNRDRGRLGQPAAPVELSADAVHMAARHLFRRCALRDRPWTGSRRRQATQTSGEEP